MLERDFQRRVVEMATRFGWKVWHVPAPMRADRAGGFVGAKEAAGIADLILTHDDPPRLVFMELKADGGKLSDRQTEFLQAVKAVADKTVGFVAYHHDLGRTETPPEVRYHPSVGVYAFWPQDEPLIEQLLRSRVLT